MNNFFSCCYLKKIQRSESFQYMIGKNCKIESDFFSSLYIEKQGFLSENYLFQNSKKQKKCDLLNFPMFRKQWKTLYYSFKNHFVQSLFLLNFSLFSQKYSKYFLLYNSKVFLSFFQSFLIWKKKKNYLRYFSNLEIISSFFEHPKFLSFLQKGHYFPFQQKFFSEKLKIYEYLLKFFSIPSSFLQLELDLKKALVWFESLQEAKPNPYGFGEAKIKSLRFGAEKMQKKTNSLFFQGKCEKDGMQRRIENIDLVSEKKKANIQQNKKQFLFFSQFFLETVFLSFSNSKNFQLFENNNISLQPEKRIWLCQYKEKRTLFFETYFSFWRSQTPGLSICFGLTPSNQNKPKRKNLFFVQITKQENIFLSFFWEKRLFLLFLQIFFSEFQFFKENWVSKEKNTEFQTFQKDLAYLFWFYFGDLKFAEGKSQTKTNSQNKTIRNDFVLKTVMRSDLFFHFEKFLKKKFFIYFFHFSKSYILLSFYYQRSNFFFDLAEPSSNNLDFVFHHYQKLPFWTFQAEIIKNPDFSFSRYSLTSLNSEEKKTKGFVFQFFPEREHKAKETGQLSFEQANAFLLAKGKGEKEMKQNLFLKEMNLFFDNVYFSDFASDNKKNFWQTENIYFFQNVETYFFLKNCQNQKKNFHLVDFSSIRKNISLEKTFFHCSQIFQLKNEKNNFLKKSSMQLHSMQFPNFLSFFNEFHENSSGYPIYLLFTNYFSNFFISNSFVSFFLKDQKIFEKYRGIFSDLKSFQSFVFSQFSFFNLFFKNRSRLLYEIPFSSFLKLFHAKKIQKKGKSQNIIKFFNTFWNVSKQFCFLKSFGGRTVLYLISPFFANFLIYNNKSWKIKRKNAMVQKRIGFGILGENAKAGRIWLSHSRRERECQSQSSKYFSEIYNVSFDYNEFSILVSCWYEKNFKRKFRFEKIPTFREVNRHLNECKQIIKNSIGKNQFSFMKKLQRKIQIWVNKYSSVSEKQIFSYCDSILFQFLWNWAQKTHPKKSKFWIRKKYFHFLSEKKWFFGFAKTTKTGTDLICLPLHAQK